MAEPTDHTHTASNGRAELSLDELAFLHEGLGRYMFEASERMRRCYHAAKAKNTRLARFQLSEASKSLRFSVLVRPQYADAMERFIEQDLGKLRGILEREDWPEFDRTWAEMTSSVNRNHAEFDHGFLVWKVSEVPPGDLDLTPPAPA